MTTYRISWEIELDAETPLEAAHIAQDLLREDDWQFYVQDSKTNKIFSVDLQEEDENAVLPVKPKDYQSIIEK